MMPYVAQILWKFIMIFAVELLQELAYAAKHLEPAGYLSLFSTEAMHT